MSKNISFTMWSGCNLPTGGVEVLRPRLVLRSAVEAGSPGDKKEQEEPELDLSDRLYGEEEG